MIKTWLDWRLCPSTSRDLRFFIV